MAHNPYGMMSNKDSQEGLLQIILLNYITDLQLS
jgi:hypothetical protein